MSPTPLPSADTSPQATSLARLIDRVCRLPGRYLITLELPEPRRAPWRIEIARVEPLQRRELRRELRRG